MFEPFAGRGHHPLISLALSAAMAVVATSCGDEVASPGVVREADMYEAAVDYLIESSGVELSEGWADPIVFVEVLHPDGVDLETQVAVVDDFDDDYRIRFVDELAEAVEVEVVGLPVREGTLLIAFGPIEVDGTSYVLHAEYYLASDDTAAYSFHFENRQPVSAERPEMIMTEEPVEVATELVVEAP